MNKLSVQTSGGGHVLALVDDDDYAHLSAFTWRLLKGAAVTRIYKGKRDGVSQWTRILMHRMVMGVGPGDLEVDHINRNPLDNRKENLRLATHAQNHQNKAANRVRRTQRVSRHRGVTWNSARQKWYASAGLNGKLYNLGLYTDEDEAARVASEWRRQHMPFAVEPA